MGRLRSGRLSKFGGSRRRIVVALERLDERVLLSAVTMQSVTEANAHALSITYQVASPAPTSVEVDFYRAASSTFDKSQSVLIGSTVLSGAQLSAGPHNAVLVPLPNNPNGPDPLSPDPLNKFVFAVAQNPDGSQSAADFEKLVFAAVTHGYEFFSSSTPPAFVTEIANALDAEGYLNPVIPFNWTATSGLSKPNEGIMAGDKLAGEIVAEIQGLVANGTIPASAVVDVQLISHSRGSVVMTRVAQDLSAELDQIPNTAAGYWKLTYLDPHPSHSFDVVHLAGASGTFSQYLLKHGREAQAKMMDPFPLEIPAQVADVEDYYETTDPTLAPAHSDESYINPWGTSLADGGFKLDSPTFTEYHAFHFSIPGIAHSQVHDWYLLNILPLLKTATGFVTTPDDALLRPSAVDISGVVGQATAPDYVATFTDDDPTATDASDYTATVNWGDGTSETDPVSANLIEAGFTVYATHTYTTAGKFPVTITIKDLKGTQDSGGSVAVASGTATISANAIEAIGAPAGSGPLVTLEQAGTGQVVSQFLAYPASFKGGVRVTLGDVNGDGVPDIIVAPAHGGLSLVKVFSGLDHHLISRFSAFGSRFSGGVFVAAADINHAGRAEVITGTGAGRAGRVRVFDGNTGTRLGSLAVPGAHSKNGVPVAAIDVNHDRFLDIVVGATGSEPSQVFDGQTLAAELTQEALFAQTRAQVLRALKSVRATQHNH